MELLVMIDMQNDFLTGPLGNENTKSIIEPVCAKIEHYKKSNLPLIYTMDTHNSDYLSTQEGKKLPVPHCISNTSGWELPKQIQNVIGKMDTVVIFKNTFGAKNLPEKIQSLLECYPDVKSIKLIGVCTDICVISNAMLLKAFFPEIEIKVESKCCAGVTPESHQKALDSMASCQITIE